MAYLGNVLLSIGHDQEAAVIQQDAVYVLKVQGDSLQYGCHLKYCFPVEANNKYNYILIKAVSYIIASLTAADFVFALRESKEVKERL